MCEVRVLRLLALFGLVRVKGHLPALSPGSVVPWFCVLWFSLMAQPSGHAAGGSLIVWPRGMSTSRKVRASTSLLPPLGREQAQACGYSLSYLTPLWAMTGPPVLARRSPDSGGSFWETCPYQPLTGYRNHPLRAWDAQTSPLCRQLELGESDCISGILGTLPLISVSRLDDWFGAVNSRNASCQQPVSVFVMAAFPAPSPEPDRGDDPEGGGRMAEGLVPTQPWRKQGPWPECGHTQSPPED